MAQYTQEQQVFALSSLSNLSGEFTGDGKKIAEDMKPLLVEILGNQNVQDLIGTWELVWGPVVDVSPIPTIGNRAINTMFIARSAGDTPQYVVAIAGTDAKSKFDWIIEDFWVDGTVVWPYLPPDSPVSPRISDGTHFGLDKLIGMTDGGLHGRDYLQNNAATQPGTNVTVTGHSLGGALSPSYALYLHDTRSQWDSAGNVTLFCQPTAGPTPGDDVFANYYDGILGANTNRVWNKYDTVPHAWEKDMLQEVPNLYAPTIEPNWEIKVFADVALFVSRKTPYTQLLSSVPGSDSTVVPVGSGSTFEQFMKEICYQHIDAYINIFQMSEFQAAVTQILNNGSTYFSCDITPAHINAVQMRAQQINAEYNVSQAAPTTTPTSAS